MSLLVWVYYITITQSPVVLTNCFRWDRGTMIIIRTLLKKRKTLHLPNRGLITFYLERPLLLYNMNVASIYSLIKCCSYHCVIFYLCLLSLFCKFYFENFTFNCFSIVLRYTFFWSDGLHKSFENITLKLAMFEPI